MLHPQSAEAEAIARLAWLLIGGGTAVFVLVMVLLAVALWKRPRWLRARRTIVIGGAAFPTLVVFALLLYSVDKLDAESGGPAVRVEVVGHQWWWQVRYLDAAGNAEFETANELRIPVGRTVELALASGDVLHSFWVPNLAGKLDLVPGRVNRLRFTPKAEGTFRGQCAEYCGTQHANMGLFVVVVGEAAFSAWSARQRTPARETPPAAFSTRCSVCHAIRGTPSAGARGPDLTHIGSRLALAAATLPNTQQALAAWITRSQHLKPGNLMPAFEALTPDEAQTIAAYLSRLE